MSGSVFDETPIFITRLVVDVVGMMKGGAAHVGRVGPTVATRSATSWRARKMSVPGLKRSSIDESWGIDFERTRSRPGMPCITCSIGTVTRLSTSAAESPRQVVWISTRGWANSGKASTGMARSFCPPKNNIAAPATSTTKRKRRLDPTTQRIMVGQPPLRRAQSSSISPYSTPQSSTCPTVTTEVPAGGPRARIASPPLTRTTLTSCRTYTSGSGLVYVHASPFVS